MTYDFHAPVVSIEGERGLDLDALGKYKEGVVVTFNEGDADVDGGSSIDNVWPFMMRVCTRLP